MLYEHIQSNLNKLNIAKVFEDGWNEKVEYDLCTLWDMTAEKDIVNFLVENDFLKIAEFALNSSEEPRFTVRFISRLFYLLDLYFIYSIKILENISRVP